MANESEAQPSSEREKQAEASERRTLSPEEVARIWTKVRFDAPFALQNADLSYNFGHGGVAATIKVSYQKRSPDEIAARTGWKSQGTGAEFTIVGDASGRTDFSEFVVGFQSPLPFLLDHLSPEQRVDLVKRAEGERLAQSVLLDSLLRQALLVANEVIDGYTRVTASWLVRPLRMDDLMSFDVYHELDGEPLKFAKFLMYFPLPPHEMGNILVKPSDKPTKDLLEFLNRSARLQVFVTLETRALRSAATEDTRSAIIDAWTALEVYVDNVLETGLREKTRSMGEVKKLLELRPSQQPKSVREAINLANIEPKVRAGLRKAFDVTLAGDSKFWSSFNEARDIRNDATHGGVNPTLQQAVDALNIVRTIVNKVEEKLGH